MTDKVCTYSLITPELRAIFFTPEAEAALAEIADVTWIAAGESPAEAFTADRIGEATAVVTSWGTPPLTDALLDAAPQVRAVIHSAGSVKHLVTEAIIGRLDRVTSASAALAPAVAESALMLTLMCLNRAYQYAVALKRDGEVWPGASAFGPMREIAGRTIGVISAGYVGRLYIEKVRALGAEVVVYDPWLSETAAAGLGVRSVPLAEAMAQTVVAIHAPVTPETRHMIGGAELAAMPDDGILINTARSWVVDQEALMREVESGRIQAALDVFDTEPLPLEHPFRSLPNVLIQPHTAGASVEARHRQGDAVVEELRRFRDGVPPLYGVTAERYRILA